MEMAAISGVISRRQRRSCASDLPAESTQCIDEEEDFRLLELEVQKGLGLDEESMKDMTESISDADFALSPFSFDFESQWETINQGMDIGPQLDLFSEIVAANKEVAVSRMNYYQLEDEDILLDIKDNDKLIIPPLKIGNGLKRPHPTTEEPTTFGRGLIAQIKDLMPSEMPRKSTGRIKYKPLHFTPAAGPAPIFASAVRAPSPQGQQAAKRVPPEVRPLTSKTAVTTTNAPPGVVINTNRISQPIRMAGSNLRTIVNSSTVTVQLPTSASQMVTPHRSPIIQNPQALASHIITTANNSSIRTPAKASAPGKITIQPNTLANLSSTSPAVRLPMSSLYRRSTTRPAELVRRQLTGAAPMVRPTTTSAHPRNSTAMPAFLSAVSLVPSNTSNIFTLNGLHVSVVSNDASNVMSCPTRPVVSVQLPMGTTTLFSSTTTTPTPLGITAAIATDPTVARTSSTAPIRPPFIIRLTNTSTAECNASSGEQVTYLVKVASTSASMPPVQSRSGFTTVRYVVPNNPLRMTNLPSSISVRPATLSSAPSTSTFTTETAPCEPKADPATTSHN